MSAIGNFIFETTGLLSKRGLIKRASAIGKEASEVVLKEGGLTSENASRILANNLGKRAKKITVATNRADASKAISESQGIPEELAGAYYDSGASISVPGKNGKNTVIGLKTDILATGMLSNVLSHESEHALHQTFSVRRFFEDMYSKTPWGKKLLKYYESKAAMLNMRQMAAQNGLVEIEKMKYMEGFSINPATKEGVLKQCGCKSIKELHQKIREFLYEKGILTPENFEDNRLVAKVIKLHFKDEARAYKVGGMSEKAYKQMLGMETEGKTTLSELHSRFYDEVIKVARKEEWHAKINKWKTKLGLKPNTKAEEQIVERAKEKELKLMEAIKQESKEIEVPVEVIRKMYEMGDISKGLAKKLGVEV